MNKSVAVTIANGIESRGESSCVDDMRESVIDSDSGATSQAPDRRGSCAADGNNK